MTEQAVPPPTWFDLTVADAVPLRDLYCDMMGLVAEPVDMGGYSDFMLVDPASDTGVAGVCHARGMNAGLPPVWLVYFTVPDLRQAIDRAAQRGGRLASGPKGEGPWFGVVQDPAGAYFALYQPQS